jgi:hypothetical protein
MRASGAASPGTVTSPGTDFCHARERGGDFIIRIGWNSLKLYHPSGEPLDLFAFLPAADAGVVEHAVRIGSGHTASPARLLIAPIPADALERQHKRIRRKASKKGTRTDPRTLHAAGYLMVVTSLSAKDVSAAEIVRLYRLRWQIELAFKRLKSLGRFDALRADDPRLVRSWLLVHLIATVLIEDTVGKSLTVPPWADHFQGEAHLTMAGLAHRTLLPLVSDIRAPALSGTQQPTAHTLATTGTPTQTPIASRTSPSCLILALMGRSRVPGRFMGDRGIPARGR